MSCSLLQAAPPAATNDNFTTAEDTPLVRTAANGLRANDSNGTATDPAAGLLSAPTHGTVTLTPDGAFTYTPARDYSGTDGFTYAVFGDRPVTAFTIDQQNSNLTVGATLRITYEGIPSVSSDSSTSHVKGTLAAAIGPNAAPFSVARVTDMQGVLSDPVTLKLGIGCIPIINTCLAGVQFDSAADAITLSMNSAGPTATVRTNGGFDTDGSTFSTTGGGTVKGTDQLEGVLPPTPLPLNLPPVTMPFNGRLTSSGGIVRLEMQINYRGSVSVDATTSFSFSLSGTIRATAPAPLAPVEVSAPAGVALTITPVNDAPLATADNYLVRAGTALTVSASGAQSTQEIIPAGAVWKYNHTGADLGTAWRTWGYNDQAWSSGPAELGYGDAGILGGNHTEATNIKGSAARPTAYFRKDFTLTDVNSTRSLSMELLRDDGAAVYLNGFEVNRQNLAAGAVYATLADSRIPNADETRFFPATIPPELLLEGRNVLAVEVHQYSLTDLFSIPQIDPADLSFDFKLQRVSGLTGVLTNDTDIDSTSLTVSVHTPPAHGQLTLQPDGAFTYTPDAGFTGTDRFIYRSSDGGTENAEVKLIAAGSAWKYLDDGSDQNTAWRAPGFADASWATGIAEIGYGDDNTLDDRPEVTKLSYLLGTPPVTTYFRRTFTLPLPAAMLQSLKLRLLRDDGAAVYLNGVEIARDNLAAGALYNEGALLPVEGENEVRFFEYTVSAAGLAALT
ncbi:MAG TPA: Ig-like domain-containing protein, partial [Verrucomicrobiales bacterium]|nr:Ig-like domain-containing protein [Verrucomicrobiales bacterium]